ncbi:cobyric acid synthase [Ramlibacter sp.]|uniref:cobyric acid synthase n=1 Tax=Ramlibacter sp. TaxID=1917967 RepID=UPI002617D921|nr:cobyric acid synthase [Ramlibacter sp.]MDB5956618.1 cobalamin biosynthesis protein CobQ [Ramlibacter sp.]
MNARCIMVWGTSSGAGKSWLATALCRWYARQGLRVAPFKAQNMSNNARVVADAQGRAGEIGSAQYFQALAARREPDVRMNPVLLKPEADTHSQVVVMGQVDAAVTALPWRERSAHLWPTVAAALDSLRAENDLVVIEGAGSPAEINLHDCDFVNLRVAQHAQARCLLVTDIDRGGAFAHLYGTWALLPPAQRALLHGFVLNRFRGDPALLDPGPQELERLAGVPVVATLPMVWQHGLPQEDGLFDQAAGNGAARLTIAVIAYPRISNLDEFQPLANLPGVHLRWVRSPAQLAGADWIVLPGSKNTMADLQWLRVQGLARAVADFAQGGGRVLGICGGLQMLGEALVDPDDLAGNGPGLGLLPLATQFAPHKTVRRTTLVFEELAAPWDALSGRGVTGYEIHQGHSIQHAGMAPARIALAGSLGWQNAQGNVLGVYLHGLFEDPAVLQALFGAAAPTLETVFDRLADVVDRHFATGVLPGLIAC